jgi:hypothetical protein
MVPLTYSLGCGGKRHILVDGHGSLLPPSPACTGTLERCESSNVISKRKYPLEVRSTWVPATTVSSYSQAALRWLRKLDYVATASLDLSILGQMMDSDPRK